MVTIICSKINTFLYIYQLKQKTLKNLFEKIDRRNKRSTGETHQTDGRTDRLLNKTPEKVEILFIFYLFLFKQNKSK